MTEKRYVSKQELWMQQAPSFNFELGKDELLVEALESGFVTEVGKDRYLINENYGEEKSHQ